MGVGAAELRRLEQAEARALLAQLRDRYTGGAAVTWWWEHFPQPLSTWCPADGEGFERLPEIVPDPRAPLWFVVLEHDSDPLPIYQTSARHAAAVIAECTAFEYALVAADSSWLVCENHHDTLFAVGEPARTRLEGLAASLG